MKRKLFICCAVLIPLVVSSGRAGEIQNPLLLYRVYDNDLTPGEYTLVRSYRKVTQILISHEARVFLYTDRDNSGNSEIFSSGYSYADSAIIPAPPLSRHEFGLVLRNILATGTITGTEESGKHGTQYYIRETAAGRAILSKNDNEYTVIIRDTAANHFSRMDVDTFWARLVISSVQSTGIKGQPHEVLINESGDRIIRNVIAGCCMELKKIKER